MAELVAYLPPLPTKKVEQHPDCCGWFFILLASPGIIEEVQENFMVGAS